MVELFEIRNRLCDPDRLSWELIVITTLKLVGHCELNRLPSRTAQWENKLVQSLWLTTPQMMRKIEQVLKVM